jgi:protein O-GlcNAc transferase
MPDNNPNSTAMTIQQAFNLALQHHQAGRLAEAESIYRQILARQPDHAEALHLLGVMAHQARQYQKAVELINRAIAINPRESTYQNNLGNTLKEKGQLEEAGAAYHEALRLNPNYAVAHSNLGNVLLDQGRLDEAIAEFRIALKQRPDMAEIHFNLGSALNSMGRFDEAIAEYRQTIRLKPDWIKVYGNLSAALSETHATHAAIAVCQQALRIKPNHSGAYNNLGVIYKNIGQLDDAVNAFRTAIRINPVDLFAHDTLLFCLNYHPDYSSGAIYEELVDWNRQHAAPLKQFTTPHAQNRDPERRVKIGYVSADFREHVVGRNLLPLFKQHQHEAFEIFCYTNSIYSDALADQLRSCADVWRNIANMSDLEAAEIIRKDQIDILVDLGLHTRGNRLLMFAHKPAPVQVTFMGYPGSTGLETMDYRLTDPYLDPPGLFDDCYSEESIRLPDTFWCYDLLTSDSRAPTPEINDPPVLQNGFVTFGCLNNSLKVNNNVLKLWAKVLMAVSHSRLMLLAPMGQARQRVLEVLQAQGIENGRVEFVEFKPRTDYLKSYHRIDVGLDTLPYNGHTTSLDSFWMGVPVVTLMGKTVVGRAGWSQLCNLDLKELAAQTPEQFVEIALKLASDLPRLKELRSTLRQKMLASPLMDAPCFARNVEAAYREMWKKWCDRRR